MPLKIVRNNIVHMHADAIVNAANPCPGFAKRCMMLLSLTFF